MKNLEYALLLVLCIFVGIMTYGMFEVEFQLGKQRQNEQQRLEREHEQFESALSRHEVVLGKYSDSISDEMLHDFYPEITNLDSLRSCLKEKYEIRLRTEKDGLCY